ncbi:cyclin-dependent kinase inhibitor 7-like isoform X2 [Solanum dulcamara]|uniref:cyclin-dependent kinase inhibitor 7-like isoform X2 n=1 Tax=Solanum dulcamara TaxID=45834 RepID=UPI0024861FC9|nr:cyclin-dependent kinase inhibitor 7-like isoform X2 [Solanum dulcamara]
MEVVEVPVKMTREREVLEVAETRKRKNRDDDLVEMSPTAARVRSHSGVSVAPASFESPASEFSSQGNTVSYKPAVSSNFDDGLPSCFGDNESSDVTKGSSKFVDLDEDGVEIATSYSEFRERETILSSKFKVELHKLESTPKPQHAKSCRRRLTETKMPSEVDLDEFFAAAEKDLHKHFAEKYNFDFAKEEPLEGRYKWVKQ